MRHLALVFIWLLAGSAFAADKPVDFQGAGLAILHDGSPTAFNPHTDEGRRALLKDRGVCCVEAARDWHGPAETFVFKGDPDKHVPHEERRYVLNPQTNAFVSSTTLQDTHLPPTDPHRYVDPDITPAVALNDEQVALCHCQPGDRVQVSDPHQRLKIWAVYANNAGNNGQGVGYTEISAAAAAQLRIPLTAAREPKTTSYRLELRVYPNSAMHHFPRGGVNPVDGQN